MRTHLVFRPRLAESLEARVVPSTAAVSSTATFLGITVSLPSQVQVGNARVQAIIQTFDQTYERAVESVLFAPGPGGTINLAANRAAFDAAIVSALDDLAAELVRTLGDAASGSPAATQVVDAITGNSPNSLESQLLALPTVAIEPAVATVSVAVPVSYGTPVPALDLGGPATLVRPTNRVPVAQAVAPAGQEIGGAAVGASTDVAQEIRKAFGTFLDEYFLAMKGVLLANQGGAVGPQASRADFDARVGQALQSLDRSLTGALVRDPSTSGLAPQVRDSIAGARAASLKSRLKGLPTPDGPQAAVVREFTIGSVKLVADALSAITGHVSQALNPR